jgi:hypothetical protein
MIRAMIGAMVQVGQATGWRRGFFQAAFLMGFALPAAAADPRDDIVLGALLAEFYLAVAVSFEEPAGEAPATYSRETIGRAAQLSRLIAPQGAGAASGAMDGLDAARDFDRALGAFLAFAARMEKSAGAPLEQSEAQLFACQLVGGDPVDFAELGRQAGIDGAGAKTCIRDFEKASAHWNERFSSFRLGPGLNPPLGSGPLYVEIAPVFNPANEAIAESLRNSQIYDLLAERLNAQMVLPSARVLLVTECGGSRAFFNPERREIVLCDERIAGWIAATAP